VNITRLVSFGTCYLHDHVANDIDKLTLPGAGYIASLTVLPCPVIDYSLHSAGMFRPLEWNGSNSSIEVPADALLYGIPGGVINCPNYSFDLWKVLAEVAMVSGINEEGKVKLYESLA
jgi:hypothetical protein